MERELVAVGMNLKALEVHEERALQRENSYSDHVQSLQNRIKEVTSVAVSGDSSKPIVWRPAATLGINIGRVLKS